MSTMSRLLLSVLLACCAQAYAQQGYPNKAIRIIVPSPAGGPTDVLTRLIGEKMAESFGHPVLAGLSRKSMLGRLIGRPGAGHKPGDRLAASLAAALLAAQHGARILRVHDVAATRDALAIWTALRDA